MISKMISDKELRDATAMVRTSMLESMPKEMNARHVELYAAEDWLWYTDVLTWGKIIIPIVIMCLIVKIVVCKR